MDIRFSDLLNKKIRFGNLLIILAILITVLAIVLAFDISKSMIIATLLGPLIAIQTQKFLERRQEIRNAQVRLFKNLMITRAKISSPLHEESLNVVPVDFYGNSPQLKSINTKWTLYFEHLNNDKEFELNVEDWVEKREELLYNLLVLMSDYLKYDFNEVTIKQVYVARVNRTIETEERTIRSGLATLFKGESSVPIEIKKRLLGNEPSGNNEPSDNNEPRGN